MVLPQAQADKAPTLGPVWKTYDLLTGDTCVGPSCSAFGVIECVKHGAQALLPDEKGNIGCNNTGEHGLLVGGDCWRSPSPIYSSWVSQCSFPDGVQG
jgi:hypothetical protein